MRTQAEKGSFFRSMHEREGAFLIPNPWDPGSARMLAHLGFEALATTSAGFAFSQGKPDTLVGREAMMAHVASIATAVDLPVSGDLENGYGDDPETVAETIRMAADAGLVGASIEDSTGRADNLIYEISYAIERIEAAVKAAHALPFPFTLTARAENFLHGRPDLDDTILRLRAYQEAGADVLYAPGLNRGEDIAAVVRSVDRPVNVLALPSLNMATLSELGVKRVSTGGALARAAFNALANAASEMHGQGTFAFAEKIISYGEMNAMFQSFR